jgi:hypothetical protein
MAFHLQYSSYLREVDLLSITQADNFIKRTKKLECALEDFFLLGRTTQIRDYSGKQVQGINVLQYIGRFVRDEENIEILEWLVNIADFRSFDRCVLRMRGDQLWEGREKRFDSSPRHFAELARDDGYISSESVMVR